jgi:hypothetical protein
MSPKPERARLTEDLRHRLEALTVEDPADQRQVARYLAPGAVIFRSGVDYMESLLKRNGCKFDASLHQPPHE